MSKLTLFTLLHQAPANGSAQDFLCTFQDELRFSGHLGETILIANVAPNMAQAYVAIGSLQRFWTSETGDNMVRIEEIRSFPSEVALLGNSKIEQRIAEVSQADFERIVAFAIGGNFDDAPFSHDAVSADSFAQQLRRAQDDRCGFSDAATEQGTAFMIQPPEHGGRWHTSNFLFLDPEAGKLFADFAWTVGPRFEIIIDAYATSADISDTVNRTGMLALKDMVSAWPDRDALTWHREQFFARLRG